MPFITNEELNSLRRDREILIEALLFYADPETYLAVGFFPDPPCGDFMEDWSDTGEPYGLRPGKKARDTLDEVSYWEKQNG